MSKQRGCIVAEMQPGKWFCAVADREHDYDFESGTVYGPASSEEGALDLMDAQESNPGGFTTYENKAVDKSLRKLFDRLPKARRRSSMSFSRSRVISVPW
jgi:hypothetical protein